MNIVGVKKVIDLCKELKNLQVKLQLFKKMYKTY